MMPFANGAARFLIDHGIIIGIARSDAGLLRGRPSEFIGDADGYDICFRRRMPPHDPRKRNPLSLE
jgi:hypothetical protein